jgi:hypothetical protein
MTEGGLVNGKCMVDFLKKIYNNIHFPFTKPLHKSKRQILRKGGLSILSIGSYFFVKT